MSNRLKEVREMYKITQEDVAKKCGTSVSYICRIENGQQPPTYHVMQTVCKLFGRTLDEIWGEHPENGQSIDA